MSLNQEERQIIVELEIDKSKKTFAEIEILRNAGLWNNIANRLYYAAFHAVTALLVNDGHTVGTHQGAVVQLHKYFIKTGILNVEDGAFYSQLQTLREKADYNCTYNATEKDINVRIGETEQFINKIFRLIGVHQ